MGFAPSLFNLKFMYRLKEIQEALLHVVGWKQNYNPELQIDKEFTQSESGLYFQMAHPLVTIDNMASIIPDNWGLKYPDWSGVINYVKGDVVHYGENAHDIPLYWICIRPHISVIPEYNNQFWKPYSVTSSFLEELMYDGISTVVQTFTQMKQLDKETRNLLEHRTFFDGAGRFKETIQNSNKLVGFEITPIRAMGVTTKIERIGLQMTGGVGVVKMYLFHSSQIDPIKTFDLDFTIANGGFQWFDMTDVYLPYISSVNDSGGSWYLCYNQRDLPSGMMAINANRDWSKEPCGSCTGYRSVEAWRELTKYLQISPFMVNSLETFNEFPELWDVSKMMYPTTYNFGINVEVSVGCDLTDFIIQQRSMFQTVIQRQVAAIALRTLALNPNVRVNRNQYNVDRDTILYELDGNTAGFRPGGLGYELKKAYEALNIDTQGIDRICLSCNNRGVRYRTT